MLLFSILSLCLGCRTAGIPLEDISEQEPNRFSCTFDGVRHELIIDLPENPEDSALVLMLHGYGSSAEAFRLDTRFHEDANVRGYTVVYVTGAPDPKDSTSANGWNYRDSEGGNKDVEFLSALALYIQNRYHTDSSRCYVAGFSNGAFMCHRIALESKGTFSAVISVAGSVNGRIWEARPSSLDIGLLQITGQKDDVIPKLSDGSYRYSDSPAIEDVITYYVDANDLGMLESGAIGKASRIDRYSSDGNPIKVWHLVVNDGRHSWSGGELTGIDTNSLILDYLDSLQ